MLLTKNYIIWPPIVLLALSTSALANPKIETLDVDLSLAIPALNETLKYIDEQIAGAKDKKLEGAQQIAPKL